MSLIEFIGFIITFFAFIIMSVRRMKEKRQMEMNPHEEEEDDEALRDYLRSVGIEVEERPKPPPPAPRIEQIQPVPNIPRVNPSYYEKPEFKTNIEDRKFKTRIEDKKLKTHVENREYRSKIEDKDYVGTISEAPAYEVHSSDERLSKVDLVINNQSLENLVISNIILGPPKAYE